MVLAVEDNLWEVQRDEIYLGRWYPVTVAKQREDFEYWLADMDDAIERFLDTLPEGMKERRDFSAASLDLLEAWILSQYPTAQGMLPLSEGIVVDALARYTGETFRKAIGGRWEIRLDDPRYIFYAKPQLTDFWDKPTPVCPLLLATASAERRTGTFLRSVLENYIREKERKQKQP